MANLKHFFIVKNYLYYLDKVNFYIEADKCNVLYVLNKDFEMRKSKFPYHPVQYSYKQYYNM